MKTRIKLRLAELIKSRDKLSAAYEQLKSTEQKLINELTAVNHVISELKTLIEAKDESK